MEAESYCQLSKLISLRWKRRSFPEHVLPNQMKYRFTSDWLLFPLVLHQMYFTYLRNLYVYNM